jgi:hypothetical protein
MRKIITMAAAVATLGFGLTALAGPASASTTNTQSITLKISHDGDSGVYGNYWANDNLTRKFSVTYQGGGVYDVTTSDSGTWNAVARQVAPLDYTGTTSMGSESGPLSGGATFVITATSPPSASALKANLAGSYTQPGNSNQVDYTGTAGYQTLVEDLFPASSVTSDNAFTTYSWTYTYTPTGEVMVQASAGNTDTPTGIFTNGG